jgi:hypothetical protein
MSVTLGEIADFMGELLGEVGGDAEKVPQMIRDRLGLYGFDPDGVEQMAATIVNLAVAQNEDPEPTIVAAFCMGVVLGAAKGQHP